MVTSLSERKESVLPSPGIKRYEIGGGTLVDVDNSQLAYTQAELSRSSAIYNYLINSVEIDKLIGANNFATYSEEN